MRYSFLLILILLVGCTAPWGYVNSFPLSYNYSDTKEGLGILKGDPSWLGYATCATKLTKDFTVTNSYSIPKSFRFVATGNCPTVLHFHPSNEWYLFPNESKAFTVTLLPGNNTEGRKNISVSILQRSEPIDNNGEVLYLSAPWNIDNLFDILDVVANCNHKNMILSYDYGFAVDDYWRSILRC